MPKGLMLSYAGCRQPQDINFHTSYWTLTSQMCGRCSIQAEEAGHSLRGALFLRSFSDTNHGVSDPKAANYLRDEQITAKHSSPTIFTQSCVIHIVNAACKAQRHVTRSTFSSELLSASDTVDHGMLLALSLHELIAGAQSAAEAKALRETGGWNVKLSLYVDAMSVYAAVTATLIKIPAEKSLLSHIQYIRGFLYTKVLEALVWLDFVIW